MPVPLRILLPRAAVFTAVAGFIVAGPIWKQGLHRPSDVLFQWVMFTGFGLDVCDVRFVEVAEDGSRSRVDRYAVLGYDDPAAAPASVKKMKDLAAVKGVARRMCKKLPEGTDLRARVRCAARTGWKSVSQAEENLCAPR